MKLGVTMEGGASRTVFSCGVADVLLEENILPDYFIGVSAGIAFGVSYLSRQKGRNLELAQKFMGDKRYMGMKYLLKKENRSFYNIPFVFDEVPGQYLPFDYKAFAEFPGQVIATVTNIHTGKPEYLEVPREQGTIHELVASCALPIFFQPVKIGKRYYLDGGIGDSVPYKQALKAGCDKNIVILTRPRDFTMSEKRSTALASRLYRKYPELAKALKDRPEQYNAMRKEMWEEEKKGNIFIIEPKADLHTSRIENDPKQLTMLYWQGYSRGKELLPALKEYLKK